MADDYESKAGVSSGTGTVTFFVHFFGALDFVAYFIIFGSEEKSCTIAYAYCNAPKKYLESIIDLKLKAAS